MKWTRGGISAVVAGTAAVMIMLSPAQPARAQSTSPCAKDIKEYCGSEVPGGGRLLRCYEANKEKMSAGCKAWAEHGKTNAAVVKDACSTMIDARCNTEKGDPLEMLECLQSNYVDLTVECRERLNVFKGKYPTPVK